MTNEQLLSPRYEVVAEDTSKTFKQGDVFQFEKIYPYSGYSCEFNGRIVAPAFFDKFPHLFKKLSWYERRPPDNMPEYVLWAESTDQEVSKVTEWDNKHSGMYARIDGGLVHPGTSCLMPATIQDYETFINSKSKP